jgi:chemotaxis response regulator CheB
MRRCAALIAGGRRRYDPRHGREEAVVATSTGSAPGTPKRVRVLVVDGSVTGRQALAEAVVATDVFTLAACLDSGERALGLLSRVHPDLVLLDDALPGLNGPETARCILEADPGVVVVLVCADLEEVPAGACSCGAALLAKSDVSAPRLADVWSEARDGLERAGAARRAARERVAESHALRAQAQQQKRRARRGLRSRSEPVHKPRRSD